MTAKAFVNGEVVDVHPEVYRAFAATQLSPDEVAKNHRIASIKALVAEKILAIAPLHTQQNLSAHRLDLMARRASGEYISEEDLELERQAIEVTKKIGAIRAAGKAAMAGEVTADNIAWPE